MVSSNHVARVAVMKHSFVDNRPGLMGTKKLEFNASLCPKTETSFRPFSDAKIVSSFGISKETAPPEIIKPGVTHPRNQLHNIYPIAMVRFRIGKQEGIVCADIISTNLNEGRYTWTEDILVQLSDKIAKNLQSMGVAGVGGLKRLAHELGQNRDWDHQAMLFHAVKNEFGKVLPLQEEQYFQF